METIKSSKNLDQFLFKMFSPESAAAPQTMFPKRVIAKKDRGTLTGKITSFVVFIGYSQNIRRQSAMCRDEHVADVVENIGFSVLYDAFNKITDGQLL